MDKAKTNEISESYTNGDRSIQAHDNTVININSQPDDVMTKFLDLVKSLPIEEQVKVMNYAVEIKKTE